MERSKQLRCNELRRNKILYEHHQKVSIWVLSMSLLYLVCGLRGSWFGRIYERDPAHVWQRGCVRIMHARFSARADVRKSRV